MRSQMHLSLCSVMIVAVCLALGLGCQANGVPTTQTVQIEQNIIAGSQIALDDASVTVTVLEAAGKIKPAQGAAIQAAIAAAQNLLNTWSQHVGDPAAVTLQAEFQTALANVNLLIHSSQARAQATTQPVTP